MKSFQIILLVVGLALPNFAFGDNVQIDASLDTGYFDQIPTRNFGAHTHVPVGQANNLSIRRALFHMDIAASIPAGSTINAVTFQFDVTRQGGFRGQQGSTFELHRVTSAWTEGSGVGDGGSDPGDGATWDNRTAVDLWTTPGGDFAGASSGSVFIDHVADGGGTIAYSLGNAQLIADVQDMLDNAGSNFGFMLKADTENLAGSAMRVTTRENANGALGTEARLVIDFTPPSSIEICPDMATVTAGVTSSGSSTDICDEDGAIWTLQSQTFVAAFSPPPVAITFEGNTNPVGGTDVTLRLVGGPEFGNNAAFIQLRMWNFSTGAYQNTPFIGQSDSDNTVYESTNPVADFVGPNGELRAEITCAKTVAGPVRLRMDRVGWQIQ